jgi:hypothetical protein
MDSKADLLREIGAIRKRVAELERINQNDFLLGVIADIRMKSGLGDKPMLSELAYAIANKIKNDN